MSSSLYPSFLHDPDEYKRAQSFWANLWHNVARVRGISSDWRNWLVTNFADGTPFLDGNPIFSRISPRNGRAVRIIQEEASPNGRRLDHWLATTSAGGQLELPIVELVIVLQLSAETAQTATELISDWVYKGEITFRSEFAETAYRGEDEAKVELTSAHQLAA